MDLLSERSYSNKTSASADAASENRDERDRYKDLAAFYNHVIRNSKEKPTKGYQARLNTNLKNANRDNAPSIRNNRNRNLLINDSHQKDPKHLMGKNLLTKNLHNKAQSTYNMETKMVESDVATCSKKIPRTEIAPKLTFVKSKSKYGPIQNTDHDIAGPSHAEKTTYCRPAIDYSQEFLKIPRPEIAPKLTFVKSKSKYGPIQNTDHDIAGPSHAEKTTYCRPAIDYSQEFFYKTMERNARLQGLVRRLVLAREKEKQNVAWNNYINELKNKHRYYSAEPRTIPNYLLEDTNPEIIDYYNTRFTWKQSDPCQNLLQDFYSASNEIDTESHKIPRGHRPLNYTPYNYENNRHCFPTSSQGRLMMINQERPKYPLANESHHRPASRYLHGSPIFVDKEKISRSTSKPNFKRTQSYKLFDVKNRNVIRSLSIQTDISTFKDNTNKDYSTDETFKDKYDRVNSNVERLKQKILQTQVEVKYCSLAAIENKLDDLIQSINTFIVEIKSQKVSTDTKSEAVSCQLSNASSLINTTKSDTFRILKREQIVCGMVQERPRSTLAFNEGKRQGTIDEILYEELHKSNKVKRDIEEILTISDRDRPSVHITFDIPTKERATEITDSLFKTRHSNVVVEEIGSEDSRRMTIAVNTDPLGLLALFRVSAETVKQILSYMPHIDYYSYLSRLPLPQLARNEMSHYVCNICGAAFGRPSQLSDHIQEHNLGNSRDCCVCRHVLDMKRHRAGLFSCQHCGQRFTRAYCRQLHEQGCGRRLGRSPEDTPSLMLLR